MEIAHGHFCDFCGCIARPARIQRVHFLLGKTAEYCGHLGAKIKEKSHLKWSQDALNGEIPCPVPSLPARFTFLGWRKPTLHPAGEGGFSSCPAVAQPMRSRHPEASLPSSGLACKEAPPNCPFSLRNGLPLLCSLDLPAVCHSLHVPNYDSSAIPE